ncbi:uncharacterized protein LOC18437563 isoform X2 [Amborella trichopoda]|uniref:uncharacterized protein LOC18437563 isoform X2 n=1 Tax=Amborella trichopoda TaxID=13333 RepID=UPI0009C04E87|nr:uncharacterized protein LOC18437563 isoform X2 [Amborella trichopoda]|eukprot:XP_020524934.1 uncharacterized protein LOC18437563 isoform X2 [Amborella trichopoda]
MQFQCFARKFSGLPLPLVSIVPPCPREAHFWYVMPDEVEDKILLSQYAKLLSPEEKEDISRMGGDKLQKHALITRTLVRTTLARYSQERPESLKFRKNKYGKPEVEWQPRAHQVPPSLHFNLSHTSSLIACGVTIDSPEVEYLCALKDPEIQRQELLKLWTLKEAYVKALGRGFSGAPFKDFTIHLRAMGDLKSLNEESDIVLEASGNIAGVSSTWQFALFELANSHYAAICMEQNDNSNEVDSSGMIKLKAWKTIPYIEDECISGTDSIVKIIGSANGAGVF